MLGEIARRSKSSITSFQVALEGLLSCVDAFMLREITRLGKSSITPFQVALEGLLSCVGAFMHGEIARLGKSSITPFALEGLLSCVDAFMNGEIARLGKSSITPFALEGLLSCVDAAVNSKLTRATKRCFASNPIALVGLVAGLPSSLFSGHGTRRVVVCRLPDNERKDKHNITCNVRGTLYFRRGCCKTGKRREEKR